MTSEVNLDEAGPPLRDAGLQLYAWTVNRPADVQRLAALGIDGITTDDPVMAKRLEDAGAATLEFLRSHIPEPRTVPLCGNSIGMDRRFLTAYLPEIEEFLEIRKPSGDFNRKALNLHHGVLIPDAFMEAVRDGAEWELKSPKDGSVRGSVDARALPI